ncbi:hypothetical protein ABPG72_010615 [Tetrahymena utriculariae]
MENIQQEFQSYLNFKDVTQLFHEVCDGLDLGEMVHTETFNLHDSMSSSELCDPKMDLKVGYKEIVHPKDQISQKLIKPANELNNNEIIAMLDNLLAQEFMWLKGYSLSQTLYKFVYFYDEATYKDNQIIKSYIEGLFLSGTVIYDTLRYSPYLREDDYIVTIFGFPKTENEQILTEAILEAEKSLDDKKTNENMRKKKNLQMNEFDAIDTRLKYRKAFLKLVHLMSNQNFTTQIEQQIQSQINSCKKRLEEIKQTQEIFVKNSNVNLSAYFQKDINKTLNCLISPRPNIDVTLEEGIQMAENFFNQLEYILSLSKERDFNQIIERIKEFNSFPKNILAKGYLDVNIFFTQRKYFSQCELSEMVKSIFRDFGLKDSHFATPGYKEYGIQCAIVIQEYIAKYLRNPYRQYRDFSKLYQDLSILISSSDKYEKENLTKKDEQQAATSWCYSLACKLMANQLHLGFQLDLYDQSDYSQIFFALEFIYNILEINTSSYILKVDKQLLQAFFNKQNIDLMKKKLKPFQKRIFNQFIFYKAMQGYCKASARLCYIMEKLNLTQEFNDQETKRNRFINRFKIFENVYYLKFSTYEQFQQKVSEICTDINNTEELSNGLNEIKEMFTQSQQLFQKIPQDDESITLKMRTEAQKLVRICVVSSMTALKIKMKLGKLENLKAVFKNTELNWYPTLEIA